MKEVKGNVLIVDDEVTARKVFSAILEEEGYCVLQASGVDQAITMLNEPDATVDAIITDLKMPGKTGLDLFNHVQSQFSHIPVIFLTAYGTIEAAVDAITRGAYHYLVKPPDYQKLKRVLAKAVEKGQLNRKVKLLHDQHHEFYGTSLLLGESPEMRDIYNTIQQVKNSSCSVLIYGETGTGKELIARSLHYTGSRENRPFVAVNCSAIPHHLIESEMFGYERGAFTGASQRRIGRIEAAAGGTLFLDEIGELDISLQSKLLRVLQEREFSRLGDNKAIAVDFRVIASTNRDLREDVEAGCFREDLFYRLNVVCIEVPPLRMRKEDVLPLTRAFIRELCAKEEKVLFLDESALNVLQAYSWPGNVRELKNVLEGIVVLARKQRITAEDLPEALRATANSDCLQGEEVRPLRELEMLAVKQALTSCSGNKSKAAQLLGVSRKTLYKKLRDSPSD